MTSKSRIAVVGGTGLVGRHVVAAVTAADHEPIVIARAHGVDIITGDGLATALRGVDAVIDVSNVTTLRRRKAVDFFTAGTRHLLAAGQRAGVRHHVALSIVGVDRVNSGYYQGKRQQEMLVLDGGQPASVLRATQFHEFAGQFLDRMPGPLAVFPKMLVQPIAAREVAGALVALAVAEPVGMAAELAGPQTHQLVDLARRVVRARGQRRLVVGVRLPGRSGRASATGGLLPTGPGPRGTVTFDEWLSRSEPTPAFR
ncbi:MAG: NAD-dependent epimerase/dehydratase family protein [Nakamurella sp.]